MTLSGPCTPVHRYDIASQVIQDINRHDNIFRSGDNNEYISTVKVSLQAEFEQPLQDSGNSFLLLRQIFASLRNLLIFRKIYCRSGRRLLAHYVEPLD